MLVDASGAICDLVWRSSELRRPKSGEDVVQSDLFELTAGIGFKFPIEAAFQVINLVEIPKAGWAEDGVVMSLK